VPLPARPESGTGAGAATAQTPARRAGRAQHSPGTTAADPETRRDHNGSLPLPRHMGTLAAAENARAACVGKPSLAARPSGSGPAAAWREEEPSGQPCTYRSVAVRRAARLESWNRRDDPAQVALRESVDHVRERIDPVFDAHVV